MSNKRYSEGSYDAEQHAGDSAAGVARRPAPGKVTLTSRLSGPVQRRASTQRDESAGAQDPERVREIAAHGVSGSGGALPHLSRIEAAFGAHAAHLEGVQAHVGEQATRAADAIGANAYATGNQIAFGAQPDLHTAAHEAAHVIQQRAGVHLEGGVGAAGDAYEVHADAVADLVVQGKSAESLLDVMAPSAAGGRASVQKQQAVQLDIKSDLRSAIVPRTPGRAAGVVQLDIKSDLRSAMSGWGTDEDAIYNRLRQASAAELQSVIGDAALMSELRDELTQGELRQVLDLLDAPPADKLRLAMQGWGTDEEYIHRVLSTATPAQLQAIAQNAALVDELEGELSGGDLRSVLNRLSLPLSRKLEYAIRGWGTDEAYIFDSIAGAPIAEVTATAQNATLVAGVDSDLSGGELHRWRGMMARRIYLETANHGLAFTMIMGGSRQDRDARLLWVGNLEVQRQLLDLVILDAATASNACLEAFQSYWGVETDVVDGAAAWPTPALRQIHTQMKALPSQDTRAGVWQRLRLTGAALLTNRAAWDGSTFSVGAQAAASHAQMDTTLSAAAAAGDTTIQVTTPGAFWAGVNISIGAGANRELATITAVAGSQYTLANPLASAHSAGEQLLSVSSVYGHGTTLGAAVVSGATTLQVTEPARFAVGDTIALDRLGPNRDVTAITAIAGNQYTIAPALGHAHPSGAAVTPDDNTAERRVNWLAATVRHEIAHAVETTLGGVTGFTTGIGGWWTGTSFDTWAGQMANPWATNDGSTISADDRTAIKDAIVAAVQSTPQRGLSLWDSVTAPHAVVTHWAKQVPVMVAADACLSAGDSFFQNANSIYASNGKRFSISWWYKTFMYHNESVVSQRVKDYGLYAPAEFFAEAYTVFYEEAGRPGITDASYGQLIRNSTWRSWIRSNVHERGLAPAGTGAGSGSPGGEGTATPGSVGYGRAAGNPGP